MDDAEFLLPGYPEQKEQDYSQHKKTRNQNKGFPVLEQAERDSRILKILQLQHAVNEYKGRLAFQSKRHQILRELIQSQKRRRNQHIYQ